MTGDKTTPLVNEFIKFDGKELQNSNASIFLNVFAEMREILFLTSLVLICFWIELNDPLPLVICGILILSTNPAVTPEKAPAKIEVRTISLEE